MGNGQMLEFASPLDLFDQPGSVFRGMCDQSSITKTDIEKARFESVSEIHTMQEETAQAEVIQSEKTEQ